MTKICTLFSGSSGNSTFISNKDTKILIDAGGTCKSICEKLSCINEDIKNIKAILLTHEHTDHIKALKVLTKRFKIPVFARKEILEFLADKELVHNETQLFDIENNFVLGDFNIHTFQTNHDSLSSIGYVLECGDNGKIGYATDLGVYSEEVKTALTGCKTVVLESNYDEAMLSCGSYPYVLKRRIMSNNGHLSNSDCANAAKELAQNGTEHFILAHISGENNYPDLAFQTTKSSIDLIGAKESVDYTLEVAPRNAISQMVTV